MPVVSCNSVMPAAASLRPSSTCASPQRPPGVPSSGPVLVSPLSLVSPVLFQRVKSSSVPEWRSRTTPQNLLSPRPKSDRFQLTVLEIPTLLTLIMKCGSSNECPRVVTVYCLIPGAVHPTIVTSRNDVFFSLTFNNRLTNDLPPVLTPHFLSCEHPYSSYFSVYICIPLLR